MLDYTLEPVREFSGRPVLADFDFYRDWVLKIGGQAARRSGKKVWYSFRAGEGIPRDEWWVCHPDGTHQQVNHAP
jgi:hypothetical protein